MRTIVCLLVSGCAASAGLRSSEPVAPSAAPAPVAPELARFMREAMNVPYSFAVMEHDGPQRPIRYRRAAMVLREAVRDLVHWQDPPVKTASARDVFFTYARQLEREVSNLEVAARAHDLAATTQQMEKIRQTCNSCHHFFRPASVISRDVLFDTLAAEGIATQEGP